jgi:hypothetical protein
MGCALSLSSPFTGEVASRNSGEPKGGTRTQTTLSVVSCPFPLRHKSARNLPATSRSSFAFTSYGERGAQQTMGVRPLRIFLALVPAIALAACNTTQPVYLHNPQTGEAATCGPYNYDPVTANVVLNREARCISDYQRQGYERAPAS